ncbi:MAG: hypothetical protein KIT45_00900 [Fimbriimonadia bacterium]|nr:hypothetical protein [Fimbriimonadia bacterium]
MKIVSILLAAAWSVSALWADTHRVVYLPTAIPNQPASLYLAAEQFGYRNYYRDTYSHNYYTQIFLTENVDFGIDFFNVNRVGQRQEALNGRWLITRETNNMPGVAVGAQSIGRNMNTQYYVAASKTTPIGLFHAATIRTRDTWGWGVGVQAGTERMGITGEYLRPGGGFGYTSVGAYYQFSKATGVFTYYSFDHQSRDGDAMGVYFYFTPVRIF